MGTLVETGECMSLPSRTLSWTEGRTISEKIVVFRLLPHNLYDCGSLFIRLRRDSFKMAGCKSIPRVSDVPGNRTAK